MNLTRDISHFRVLDGSSSFCIPLSSSWFDSNSSANFYPLQSFFSSSETVQLNHASRLLLANISTHQSNIYSRYITRCWHQTVAKYLPVLYGHKKIVSIFGGSVQPFPEASGADRFVNPFKDGALTNPLFKILAELPGFRPGSDQELEIVSDTPVVHSYDLVHSILCKSEHGHIHSSLIVAVLASSVVDIDQYLQAVISEGFYVELYVLQSLGYWGDWEWAKNVCLSINIIQDLFLSDSILSACPQYLKTLGASCAEASTIKDYLSCFESSRRTFMNEVDDSYELLHKGFSKVSKASCLCIPDRPTIGYGLYLKFFIANRGVKPIITIPHVGFSYSAAWFSDCRTREKSLAGTSPLSVSHFLRSISTGSVCPLGFAYREEPVPISLGQSADVLVVDAGCYLSRHELLCDYGYLLQSSVEICEAYNIGAECIHIRFKNGEHHHALIPFYEEKCLDRVLVSALVRAKKHIEISSRTCSSYSIDELISRFHYSIFSGPTTAMLPIVNVGSSVYVMGEFDRQLLSRNFALPNHSASSVLNPLRKFLTSKSDGSC